MKKKLFYLTTLLLAMFVTTNVVAKKAPVQIQVIENDDDDMVHPRNLYYSAEYAYEAENYEEALKYINKALNKINKYRKNEDFSEEDEIYSYLLKCNILMSLKKYKEVVQTATKGLKHYPKQGQLYGLRGNAIFFLFDYENAISDYEKSISYEPDNATFYSTYITLLIGMDNPNKALEVFERFEKNRQKYEITDYDNVICEMYYNIGVIYSFKKEYQKAIKYYNISLECDETYASAYNNRAEAYKNLGQYDKALTDYTTGLSFDEKHTYLHKNRGLLYIEFGEYEKGKKDLLRAIQLGFPRTPFIILNLAIAYGQLGNHKESARYYKVLIDNKDITLSKAGVFGNYGYQLIALEQYKEAVLAFQKALEIKRDGIDFYIGLVITYYKLGNDEKIVETLKEIKAKTKYKPTATLLNQLEKNGYQYSKNSKEIWRKVVKK